MLDRFKGLSRKKGTVRKIMNFSERRDRSARWDVLTQALTLSRSSWPHLTGVISLSLLSAGVILLLPVPVMIALDTVVAGRPLPEWTRPLRSAAAGGSALGHALAFCTLLLLGIALLRSLLSIGTWLLATYTGEKLVHDLRGMLLFRAQRLGLEAHRRHGPNGIATRIQDDAPAIRSVFLEHLVPVLSSSFVFVCLLAVTAYFCWQVAVAAAVFSPLLWLLASRSSRRAEKHMDQLNQLDNSTMILLRETFRGLQAVKTFGQEAAHDERFRRRSRQRMAEQLRLVSAQAGFQLLLGCGVAMAAATALMLAVNAVREQRLTVGGLVLVMAYIVLLYEPLRDISVRFPGLDGSLLSLRRALVLLDEAPEPEPAQPRPTPARVRGEVEFRNVSFQYEAADAPILRRISFRIAPGTLVGIVGASGAGKSTLVNLLTRFYDPSEGEILLDRTDLRQFSLAGLRHQFAVVPQDPMLFSTTVAGNIAYAAPNASRKEVIRAAQRAHADDFIRRLPQGYDTPIGQGGTPLSAGERHRIAIARAFLKNAPILIIDEPTGAVDLCAEEQISESLDALMEGRTTFMIAHRLNTIERCDRVLVLQAGALFSITHRDEDTGDDEAKDSAGEAGALVAGEGADDVRGAEERLSGQLGTEAPEEPSPGENSRDAAWSSPPRIEPESVRSGPFLIHNRRPRRGR
jgi:ATP-binding cassette subfamily B protein